MPSSSSSDAHKSRSLGSLSPPLSAHFSGGGRASPLWLGGVGSPSVQFEPGRGDEGTKEQVGWLVRMELDAAAAGAGFRFRTPPLSMSSPLSSPLNVGNRNENE